MTDGRAGIVVLRDTIAQQSNTILRPEVSSRVAGGAGKSVAAGLTGVVAGRAQGTASVVVPVDTAASR